LNGKSIIRLNKKINGGAVGGEIIARVKMGVYDIFIIEVFRRILVGRIIFICINSSNARLGKRSIASILELLESSDTACMSIHGASGKEEKS
jgi:hypothetical protein